VAASSKSSFSGSSLDRQSLTSQTSTSLHLDDPQALSNIASPKKNRATFGWLVSPAQGAHGGTRGKVGASSGLEGGRFFSGAAEGPKKLTPTQRRECSLRRLQAAAAQTGLAAGSPGEGGRKVPQVAGVGVKLVSGMKGPPICPGCGVQMQDKQPQLPGYYKKPKEEQRAEEERLADRVRALAGDHQMVHRPRSCWDWHLPILFNGPVESGSQKGS
jgi:hypothetical protein